MKQYYAYTMANRSRRLYVGVTNNLERRVYEHKHGFARRYLIDRLVHYEVFSDIRDAIAREKQVKGWLRSKKVALIEAGNPKWRDLSEDWADKGPPRFFALHPKDSPPPARLRITHEQEGTP
jgi:putative endonuclease